MNDELDQSLTRLFAAARAVEPDTARAEYGFETRLTARLRAENTGTISTWAWKLCPFFAALALAVGWWSHTSEAAEMIAPLAAEAAPGTEDQLLVSYMTGSRP